MCESVKASRTTDLLVMNCSVLEAYVDLIRTFVVC